MQRERWLVERIDKVSVQFCEYLVKPGASPQG